MVSEPLTDAIADGCTAESIALLISDPSIGRLVVECFFPAGLACVFMLCMLLCIELCNSVQSSPITCTWYRVDASPSFSLKTFSPLGSKVSTYFPSLVDFIFSRNAPFPVGLVIVSQPAAQKRTVQVLYSSVPFYYR